MYLRLQSWGNLNAVNHGKKPMPFPDRISYDDLYELLCIRHRTYVSLAERERMNNEWADQIQEKYFKNSCRQNNLNKNEIN